MLLHYGLDAGDVWIDDLIHSHSCTWDILVASTVHPAMLISTPFLGTLKAEKNGMKKRSMGIALTTRTPLKHLGRTI